MAFIPPPNYALFKKRREEILTFLRQENPDLKRGAVILFADFENNRSVFRQESSFYYLTGIIEPGAILCMFIDGRQILYLPNYGGLRKHWAGNVLSPEDGEKMAKLIGVTQLKYLGRHYVFSPIFAKGIYEDFLIDLENFFNESEKQKEKAEVFTLLDNFSSRYVTQIQLYRILLEFFPALEYCTRDLSPLVHYLRRFKSEYEIDLIYKAVQITSFAHEVASSAISPGRIEHEIQALIESVFTQAGAVASAFPSIVATGKNTIILHYTARNHEIKTQDLVVVDIGAEYGYYAADITRTYPASGKFSKRQKEVYNAVLETQTYIESIAKPGMFLNNPEKPENSLNHLALKFLEKKGFAKYYAHGIGHFLGLDVHDVHDLTYPLSAGDIFTIEPGIYIPEEELGIRIEDDYLMTDEGVVCLSFQLPRKAEDIEKMMEAEG